ncbi:MAG TPA: UDP-2,3-diacylglucosamine diphosphatase [Roseiflexaceae bacterium]|nr:UDP-2,3-diacylglucosamine diphosphatase [Roseiflexaceae bacterium]
MRYVRSVLRWGLLALGIVFAARWLMKRLWRILLSPTDQTTPPIEPHEVEPGLRRIIVSDLHWGGGDRLDDFVSDDTFAGFITTYVCADEPTELVLAGDTFEFLQVRLPDVADSNWSAEAATARLQRILSAHARAVEALRIFIAQPGNQLTLLIGNHDFELHYQAAKHVLRAALGVADSDKRVRFGLRYEGDGIYLEHGNQYDAWNRFVRFEGISQPFEVVRGTWIVKEIINPLEDDPLDIAPLLDNVKPTRAFLWYLLSMPRLRHRPSRRYFVHGLLRALWAATRPRNLRHPVLQMSKRMEGNAGDEQNAQAMQAADESQSQVYGLRSVVEEVKQAGARLFRRGAPESSEAALEQLGQEAERQLRREIRGFKRTFARAMAQIAASPDHSHNTVFVCGHTHLAQVVQLNERQTYYNTGTWTMVIRDVAAANGGQRKFPFLEVRYTHTGAPPRADLLVWVGRDVPPHPWRMTDEVEARR